MKNKVQLTLSFAAICLMMLGGYFLYGTSRVSGTSEYDLYYQHIAEGVAEVGIPSTTDPTSNSAACDRLNSFMSYRSGVGLSATNLATLKRMQANGNPKKISQAQLVTALTTASMERLQNATNAEIQSASQTLRGYTASDLATDQLPDDNVTLRADGSGYMTTSAFVSQAQAAQSQANTGSVYLSTAINNRLTSDVQGRMADLSNAGIATRSGISPLVAMMVVYSIAADDPLAYNQTGLTARMSAKQSLMATAFNEPYGSPAGKKAFGTNGYLYSSPVDLLLNDATTARVLTLINQAN